jgi:hypothetical protein
MFGIQHYMNPAISGEEEFNTDYKKFKLINRLFKSQNINWRLLINTVILLQNVFGVEATVALLFYHTDSLYYSKLKSVVIYLDYMSPTEMLSVINDDDLMIHLEKII